MENIENLSTELDGIKNELFLLSGFIRADDHKHWNTGMMCDTLETIALHIERISNELSVTSKTIP